MVQLTHVPGVYHTHGVETWGAGLFIVTAVDDGRFEFPLTGTVEDVKHKMSLKLKTPATKLKFIARQRVIFDGKYHHHPSWYIWYAKTSFQTKNFGTWRRKTYISPK